MGAGAAWVGTTDVGAEIFSFSLRAALQHAWRGLQVTSLYVSALESGGGTLGSDCGGAAVAVGTLGSDSVTGSRKWT
jgi:hypothetical protein